MPVHTLGFALPVTAMGPTRACDRLYDEYQAFGLRYYKAADVNLGNTQPALIALTVTDPENSSITRSLSGTDAGPFAASEGALKFVNAPSYIRRRTPVTTKSKTSSSPQRWSFD